MAGAETSKMLGEWVGLGTMTVGSAKGDITEYLKLEPTDFPNNLSYVRKSRIVFHDRTLLHNEIGYMKPNGAELMLSRGSYVILGWDNAQKQYAQIAGSNDSRNMTRKVTFPSPDEMVWDNDMEVQHDSHWARHTAITTFKSITRASP